MSFDNADPRLLQELSSKMELLTKSFSAGYQNLSSGGRTGTAALTREQLDDVIKTITLEDSDFYLTKDIPTVKSNQMVWQYVVKTAVRSGVDLAGSESFLPQEDASQYMRVAEILKIYGIRKSITDTAMLVNEAGGFMADLEKENDLNASLAMAEAMERDCYQGGDYFMSTADGSINYLVASDINGPLRQVRGIQANVREGDKGQRGIPGDFVGYGNNRSVVFDNKGGVLNRKVLDKLVTAVRDSRGMVKEAHCTTSQLAEFRATFFPLERGDINQRYAINGAGVTNDEKAGYSVGTVAGNMDFIPTVFKYNRLTPEPVYGNTSTPAPSTPAIASVAAGSAIIGAGSGFKAGETYRYRIQACNVGGISQGSASVAITVASGDDDKPNNVTITNVAGVEYYMMFRSPTEANGRAGTEFFCGKVLPTQGVGTTVFIDNNRLIPGLDTIVFLPRDKNRAKLITLGNLLNKIQLGRNGTATETIYISHFGLLVERPRSLALLDNTYEQREGL